MTGGMLVGQMIAGAIAEIADPRVVILSFNLLAVAAAILIIGGNRKEVAKIYNTDN
jgi:predicted MFS family arabinose efflux permease